MEAIEPRILFSGGALTPDAPLDTAALASAAHHAALLHRVFVAHKVSAAHVFGSYKGTAFLTLDPSKRCAVSIEVTSQTGNRLKGSIRSPQLTDTNGVPLSATFDLSSTVTVNKKGQTVLQVDFNQGGAQGSVTGTLSKNGKVVSGTFWYDDGDGYQEGTFSIHRV